MSTFSPIQNQDNRYKVETSILTNSAGFNLPSIGKNAQGKPNYMTINTGPYVTSYMYSDTGGTYGTGGYTPIPDLPISSDTLIAINKLKNLPKKNDRNKVLNKMVNAGIENELAKVNKNFSDEQKGAIGNYRSIRIPVPAETDLSYLKDPKPDIDYRSVYVPGRVGDDVRANSLQVEKGTAYGLDDYHWYPEDFTRFYNEDIFAKADEQFNLKDANNANVHGFVGMKINQVRNEINGYVKQVGAIKDRVEGIIDKAKGIASDIDQFGIKGFLFGNRDQQALIKGEYNYDRLVSTNPLFENIPVVNVTEIQPQQDIQYQMEIFKNIGEIANYIFEGKGDIDRIKALGESIHSVIGSRLGALFGGADDPNEFYYQVFQVPNLFYTRLIGGKIKAKYTIPLSPQETYWEARGADGWEARSLLEQTLGKIGGKLAKFIPGVRSYDIQGRPKFVAPLDTHAQFETTFNLFNYNLDATRDNIKFIHALVAGAWWTQIGFQQNSSNLYDIKVPGRFRYFFCSANVKIDQVGKIRKLNEDQTNHILKVLDKQVQDQNGDKMSINPDIVKFIPDTFRVTMTFNSLLPNNLNTHLNYVYGKNPQTDAKIGDDIKGPLDASAVINNIRSGDVDGLRDMFESEIDNFKVGVHQRFEEAIPNDVARNFDVTKLFSNFIA